MAGATNTQVIALLINLHRCNKLGRWPLELWTEVSDVNTTRIFLPKQGCGAWTSALLSVVMVQLQVKQNLGTLIMVLLDRSK